MPKYITDQAKKISAATRSHQPTAQAVLIWDEVVRPCSFEPPMYPMHAAFLDRESSASRLQMTSGSGRTLPK
jgi:hypothetical protein